MRHTKFSMLLLAATLPVVLAPAGAQNAPEKKLYCWNEGGQRVCGDALPSSAVNKARTEVSSKSGMAHAQVDRALTPEELAAKAAADAQAKIAADKALDEQRRTNALAESYDSEEALRAAFKQRQDMLDEGLKSSRMAIDNQRQALVRVLQSAADMELQGKPVSPKLAESVKRQRGDVVAAIQNQAAQQTERTSLDAQLQEALAKYRKAKGIAEPVAPAVAPAASPTG